MHRYRCNMAASCSCACVSYTYVESTWWSVLSELARLSQRTILHTLTWCTSDDAQNSSTDALVIADIDAMHDMVDKIMFTVTCAFMRQPESGV